MLHQNTNLFLPEHLANAKRMSELAEPTAKRFVSLQIGQRLL